MLKMLLNKKKQYALQITGAFCAANFLLGTGKMLMGWYSHSVFTCVNAGYTYAMVAAKQCALYGFAKEEKRQPRHYRGCAAILILASLLYAVYSLRLLYQPEMPKYHPYVGIGIAAFTFTEIGLNLWGALRERNKNLLRYALKMVSLASSIIGLVLTQTALLSFTQEGGDIDFSRVNGMMGLLMGSTTAMMGIWMLRRASRKRKQEGRV